MDPTIALVIVALTVLLVLSVVKRTQEISRISKYVDRLPGDKWYPVVGTIWNFLNSERSKYVDILFTRHKTYGPICRSWFGNMPVVHIYKPEHAQVVFKSTAALSKGEMYKLLYPWLGQGLISGSGPKWKAHRKIITPAFHFQVLDSYGEIFADKAETFARYLEQYRDKGFFEITEELTRISLDIITETAMGVKLNFLEKSNARGLEYANSIISFTNIMFRRMYSPIYGNDFLFSKTALGKESQRCVDIIQGFNKEVIEARKKQLQNKGTGPKEDELGRKKRVSFLDLLLTYQNENEFGDDEVVEEVSTFMFGGFDTTVATVGFTLMALGNYPDILQKVHKELDEVYANDLDRPVTTQDLANLQYLDRVIKEVLRCYCIVPSIFRLLQEDIVIGEYTVPKGVTIGINMYDLHHDPDHYPDPFKFDPDRFLPENVTGRHPYAFVPFSAGARNCLGQKFGVRNVKTLLICLLRKYHVTCREKPQDLRYFIEIVLRPQNGLHVALDSRTATLSAENTSRCV